MTETAAAEEKRPAESKPAPEPSPFDSARVFRSRTVPSTASFADGRVQRIMGWAENDEQRDKPGRRDLRIWRRQEVWRAMIALLGTVVRDATTLQTLDGRAIGPARDRAGRILRWSYWAPARMILIDRFRRGWPEGGSDGPEIQCRAEFAAAHGIEYAVVGPGQRLAPRDVERLLNERGD